jgi:hypothetical protein
MPYTLDIDDEIARVRLHGATTGHDLAVATDELVAHASYDASLPQLWSLAGVSGLDISLHELDELISHDRALVASDAMGHVRVGIVVRNPLYEAAIRFYAYRMRSSGQEVRLFESERDAEAWLRAPSALASEGSDPADEWETGFRPAA